MSWSGLETEARRAPKRWTGRKSAVKCLALPTPSIGIRGTGDISPTMTRGCGLSGNISGLHLDCMVLASHTGKTKEDIRMTTLNYNYSTQNFTTTYEQKLRTDEASNEDTGLEGNDLKTSQLFRGKIKIKLVEALHCKTTN